MAYKYKRLYLTEKDSQVSALAVVENANEMKDKIAYNRAKGIVIVPLSGHALINEDVRVYAKEYNSFDESTLTKFPERLKLRNNDRIKQKITNALAHIKDAEEIVIATDQDNEGAAIAVNLIEKAGALSRVKFMLSMGSTHQDELRKNIDNPGKIPYLTMAEAGRARAWIDFVEGMYLSRALSYYLGNNYQVKLNFGGVKAPLIHMVVERDLAFENHVKSYFWTIKGQTTFNNANFEFKVQRKIKNEKGVVSWEDKFDSENDAKEAIKLLSDKEVKIETLVDKIIKNGPPKLFELTSLQAEMSKTFKVNRPEMSMELAQKNYDFPVSIQSYPRTEIPFLKESEYVDVPKILSKLNKLSLVKDGLIDGILANKIPKRSSTFNDKEVIAHGAIIPTLDGDYAKWLEQLPQLNKNMFELVAKRYIANFMPDYEYRSIVGTSEDIDGYRIHFSESAPKTAGWKEIYSDKIAEEIKLYKRALPDIKKGDVVQLKKLTSKKNETSPKPQFTMEELLMAMKKVANLYPDNKMIKEYLGESGIGTPATRSSIIEQVMSPERNQGEPLLIEKKGKIISTQKARDYIIAAPEELVSPIKRAILSSELKKVERGDLEYMDLISQYKKITKDNIELIKRITKERGPLIGAQPTNGLGKCPVCQTGEIIEKDKIFTCSNARVRKLEDGTFKNSGCEYKIFKSGLAKLGKKNILKTEVSKMLKNGSVEVSLVSIKTNNSYKANMVPDSKWGVKIDFNK